MRDLLLTLSLCCSCIWVAAASPGRISGAQYLELAAEACRQQHADSLDYFLSRAEERYAQQDSLVAWINGLKDISRIYRDELQKPEAAIGILQQGTIEALWRSPKSQEEWEAIGWLAVNLGYTYKYGSEQYLAASKYYQKAKEILVDQLGQEDLDIGIYIYQEWGNLKTMMGDFTMAEVLLDQFLNLALAAEENNVAAEAHNDQGVQFISRWDITKDKGALEKAISYLEGGLTLSNIHDFPKGLLHGNLVKCYMELGNRAKVLQHATQADDAIQRFYDQSGYAGLRLDQAKIKQNLGDFFLGNKAISDAIIQYEKAEQLYLEVYPSGKHRELARTYSSHAEALRERQNWEAALDFHQKALRAIVGDFEAETKLGNPALHQIRAERVIGEVLLAKARSLQARFQHQNNLDDLRLALACHDLLFEVEWRIRASYLYEASKLEHISKQQRITEEGIDMAYLLWQKTEEQKYLDLAFRLTERNKSILLLEAVRKAELAQSSAGRTDIQRTDVKYQQEIAELEKEVYAAQENSAPDSLLSALRLSLLNKKQAYTTWIDRLGTEHKGVWTAAQAQMQVMSDYQEILAPDQSLVEYFVGERSIYVFILSQSHRTCLHLPKDFPLEEWVQSFRQSIEYFQMADQSLQDLCHTYSKLGHQLYERLIEPIQAQLTAGQQLLLIPNGVLNYLPFEALLTATENSCQFSNYPYLIHDYEMAYSYSAALYLELLERKQSRGPFLGVAPDFDGQHGFSTLYRNAENIQTAQRYFDGEIFLRDQATIEQFIALAPKHQIIHLATHAKANLQAGEFSFIVFADGNGGYDSLYTRDLYLLALDAELVLLSACETAVGQLHQGEGIISLARGFLYAGARSLVTTLWQINDEANYTLTEGLYRKLRKGNRKSEALREAKLQHIQAADNMNAHPVYWAAFVSVGNQRPLSSKSRKWMMLAIGLPLLLVGGYAIRKKSTA
ncbi:MAG: CHAT domain-containing protein [Saprospiraceae bacterium]|nr:CHAT domain-containing protein [Saprospiraceae bacterium]